MPDAEKPEERSGELRDARREIAELHGIAARTHNAVATLTGQLREVVAQKAKLDRGINLNSFVSYVLFTVLLGGAFFFLYRSRAERLVSERDSAVRKRDEAIDDAAAMRKEIQARDDGARKAADYYALFRDGKKVEAIAGYAEISGARLTPVETLVFQDGVSRARGEIIDAGFAQGLEAFHAEQWKRAATELKRALAYEEEGPRAAQIRYYYGVSLHKLGDYAEAQKQLELAIAGGVERTVGVDARYYLASACEALLQIDRARTEYGKFADGHPDSPLSATARRKANELAAKAARAM